VRLQVRGRFDHLDRAEHPTHPPAGHRIGLGDAVEHHTAVGDLGSNHRHRDVLGTVVDQVLVNLIGNNPDIVRGGPLADLGDELRGCHRATRIRW
jgi:hypothetical protein